ncbi:HIRA-interacting protein 3 isoform X1 [Saccopteryx bilineata]|uniref:HIRA-interacting protein 3 isoform X1 n=2 Tax=Saccopteryx bilineata TaxID=59482 RepID=UPI00338F8321
MARENEMRKFTRSFFRGRPDLSTLTHSIVRRRFLSHTGRDHLDPEEKQTLKRLVEKELLKMQIGEAGARQEGLDLVKRAKRPATPCSDSERKRFRLNSESECSDAASSPDYFSAPAKNGTVAAVSPAEERRKRASREAAESSDEGEQWRDLTAQTGLEEEAVKGSCEEEEEEEEGSAISKIWKERSSEEEEAVEKKSKGRTRTKPVTRDKTQWKGGERQSGSGKGGGEDSRRKMKTATKGTGESAEVESIKTADSEAGDSEREVSDSEAGGTPTGERKNHSRRKSSNTSRTRSSSSSSASGSPAPKDRKVRGKMGWGTTIKNKRGPVKISASRKQATKDSEDQEEPAQRVGSKGAKSHQESEKESEGEETLAKKEQNREEEDWKPRAPSNGGKTSTWEERSEQKKGRAVRVRGDCWDREEEGKAAGSGDTSGEDEEPLVQRTSEDRTQWKGGTMQSGSGKEGGEDSGRKMKPATKGTGESAKVESGKTANSEASDSEREGTDSEAGGTPTGERKKCSRRKSSKTRTRSSSSSSASGSPDPKDRKFFFPPQAGHHHHRGEDHPAVSRLKRYIWACGARRNYKKLLGSCRSHKERLCVLRAELEALGMKGNPSLEKCRALKEQREEAAEVASLDVTNIISCSGRPRRCTAWNPSEVAPPGELYRRTLDSEEECHHPPRPDWSHMRGIISSDGESN